MGLYFLLRSRFGTETLSWVCILGAFPFAAMGFIKYNGMTAEQFVWAWIKSEFLMPKKLMFLPDNLYYETMKPTIEAYVIPIMLPISETSALYRIIVLMPLFYSQYISIMSVEQMHNGMLYAVWSIPVAIALVVIGSIISHKAFSKHQVR